MIRLCSTKKLIFLHVMRIYMSNKAVNRLKAELAELCKTNKMASEQLDR